jgi:hypothetical protein
MVAFIAAQLVALAAGLLLFAALGALRVPIGLLVPASWLGGTGMLAVERLLLAQVGLQWSAFNLALPWLAMAIVALWRYRAVRISRTPRFSPDLNRLTVSRILAIGVPIVIGVWTLILLSRAVSSAPIGWDSLVIWLFKGRVLYTAGTVPTGFFTDPYYNYIHPDYPLLVPLTVARTYAWIGENDMLVKGWWSLMAGAAAFGLYYGLSGVTGLPARLVGLVVLMSLPDMASFASGYFAGYADLPLAVFLLFGGIFLYRWLKLRTEADYLPAALFFSLAGFTKNEGLIMAVVGSALILVLGLANRRLTWQGTVAVIVVFGMIVVPWQVEYRLLGLQSDIPISLSGAASNFSARITPISQGLASSALTVTDLGLVWPLLFVLSVLALLLAPKKWLATSALLILVGANLAASTLAYLVTPYDLAWHLSTSAVRVVFQSTLLAVLLGTVYLGILTDMWDPVEELATGKASELPSAPMGNIVPAEERA